MSRLRPTPVAVFAIVTLLIWGGRVWLNWTAPHVGLAAKLALSIPITCFVVASVVLLAVMWRGIDRTDARYRGLVQGFAVGTVLFWAIRVPMIVSDGHSVVFKLGHSTFALASVVAAAWAWRALPGPTSAADRRSDAPASALR